LSHPVI